MHHNWERKKEQNYHLLYLLNPLATAFHYFSNFTSRPVKEFNINIAPNFDHHIFLFGILSPIDILLTHFLCKFSCSSSSYSHLLIFKIFLGLLYPEVFCPFKIILHIFFFLLAWHIATFQNILNVIVVRRSWFNWNKKCLLNTAAFQTRPM